MIIGKIIDDRYKVLSKIAEGGMANIFLAHDSIFDKDVCLKVLKDEYNESKYIEQFKHEVDSLAELNHENVLRVLDYRDIDDMHFIVMEYLDGITLKELIRKKGAISPEMTVDIMSKVASGLKHAHSFGLIHRDLKPQNIMILKDANIKIMDFGISQHIEEVKAFSNGEDNSIMGSVHYISPEQVKGEKIDLRSDIYALGIIMYEMLTGGVPYNGTTAVDIALMHLRQHIGNVTEINPLVPQSLSNVIIRATSPDIKLRHQDIQSFEYDLTTCLMPNRLQEEKLSFVDTSKEDALSKTQKIDLNNAKIKEAIKYDKSGGSDQIQSSDDWDWKRIAIIGGIITFLFMLALFLFGYSTKQKMPNLEGKSVQEARKLILDELGYTINDSNISYIVNPKIAPKTVWNQFPNANDQVTNNIHAADFVITLNDVKMEKFKFQDYRGENVYDVIKDLRKKHMNVDITYEDNDESDYSQGHILQQSIAPNANVRTGDKVVFSVKNPTHKVLLPRLNNFKVQDLRAFAKEHKFKVKLANKLKTKDGEVCYVNSYLNGIENKDFMTKEKLEFDQICKAPTSWFDQVKGFIFGENKTGKEFEQSLVDSNRKLSNIQDQARKTIWNSSLPIVKKLQAITQISLANDKEQIDSILNQGFR